MKRNMLGVALSTLLLTSCGDSPRVEFVTPDPAQLKACRDYAVTVPQMAAMEPFDLPDGRRVVVYQLVLVRDDQAATWVQAERHGRMICKIAADYVADWIEAARQQGHSDK